MKLRPELIFVGTLVVLTLYSGVSLLAQARSLPKIEIKLPKLVIPDRSKAIIPATSTSDSISATPPLSPTGSASPTKKPTSTPPKTVKQPTPTHAKACYRFQFVDLTGENTNLCYSQSDYNKLVELKSDWTTANTFFSFHMRGVNQYQKLYEETGSSIYLDAKASSQRQADEQQRKIDEAAKKMQEMKQLGY